MDMERQDDKMLSIGLLLTTLTAGSNSEGVIPISTEPGWIGSIHGYRYWKP